MEVPRLHLDMSQFAGRRRDGARSSGNEISILHVDDDAALTDMVATFLERTDEQFAVETAANATEGLDRLDDATFDCVVSDYDMDERNGIEFLRAVRQQYPQLPFILYTGKGSEEVASEAISAGVTDYLQKESGTSQYQVLANRIRNAVERTRVRSRLADRERHLRLFFERSPLGVIEWDESMTVARMNEKAEEILGYDEATLRGEPWTTIVTESARDKLEPVLTAFKENEGGLHHVNENVRANGERIICEWHNRVVTDEDGEVVSLFSQFQDVTERRQQTRRLRTLIDNLPGMVYRCDNGRGWPMEYVGGEAESLTGYSAETLEQKGNLYGDEIIHPEDRGRVWDSVQDALEEGRQFELTYRIVTEDDDIRWVWERGQGVYESNNPVAIEGFLTDVTEREAATQELRAEREFISQVLDTLTEVFYVVDTAGRIERWNGRLSEVTGYDDETVEGMDAIEFFRPAHRDRVADAIVKTLETGQATVEADILTADGEAITCELTGARLTDADGNLEGLVGIGREVTERDSRERAFEETNTLLSTLVETLPVGVLAEDEQGQVTAINQEMLDLFAVDATPEDARGAQVTELREEALDALEAPDRFVARIEEIFAEREAVTGETVRLADDRIVERAFRPLDLLGGEGHFWVFQDVTERQATEEKLTALHDVADELTTSESVEAVCQRTIEASEEILDFDLSAIDIARNGRMEKFAVSTGTPPEGSKTMPIEEGIVGKTYRTGESYLFDDVRTVEEANPQGPYRGAISIAIGDHGVFQAVAHEPGVFDESDLELAELLVTHAENALTRIEREQALEQRNERLDDLASIVSHDLRSPLNVAQGRIELAHEETGNEHLDAAARAVDRSLELVSDVLSLARLGEVETFEPVTLPEAVVSCWGVVETADAELVVETERTVQANRSRLRQLFENLFRNAVEHGSTGDTAEHDGPVLTVTVGDCPGGFYVADNGRGISADLRDGLFEPGSTGQDGGLGLGLSIVHRVADAHGWEVSVTESESGGARFEVTGVEVA